MLVLALVGLVAAEAEATPNGQVLHIPYLNGPSGNLDSPPPEMSANPWRSASQLMGGHDMLTKLKTMYSGGDQSQPGGIDLEQQQKYITELNAMSEEIAQQSASVSAARAQQRENDKAIMAEGEQLMTVHSQEQAQASLYNAAASVANQLLLSEHGWQSSLSQADKVENFLANDDNDILHVLDGGATVLEAAKQQISDLQTDAVARADKLKVTCMTPLFAWNFDATKQVNDQTITLVDLTERSKRLTEDFAKAHEKIVDMIGVLTAMQKEVTGTVEAESSLMQVNATLLARAKAALAQPILPLMQDGKGLDDIGFWSKLSVLKDLFEAKFGETLEPIAMLEKKFHDA